MGERVLAISSLINWNRADRSAVAGANGGDGNVGPGHAAALQSFDRAGTFHFAKALVREQGAPVDDATLAAAWKALESRMALVPAGPVVRPAATQSPADAQASGGASPHLEHVPSLYLGRYAVTNADFAQFVADDGYDDMDLWPREIWQSLLQFVDQTGMAGPRFWQNGNPLRNTEQHPVVGVCWYEAVAYARWAGLRLPTSAEWERAGSWASGCDGREKTVRYPWGNAFEPERANLWNGGAGEIVPVSEYPNGCTPNGIFQLIGNVWEWTADAYYGPRVGNGYQIHLEQPMAEIRGGAFDTYFPIQSTLQFRTGQPYFYRGANVGFRCCLSADTLTEPPDPSAFVE